MFSPSTKILIVDDMKTMRRLVRKACEGLGFSVIDEAEDGQKAWEKVQAEGNFELILSDWNMPNCTGLDFLKRVRADSRFKSLPFILLTAEAEAQQISEAIAAGVTQYIIKPFTADTLQEKLALAHKKAAG